MSKYSELVERLRVQQAAATPGPYRAHDHNSMAMLGEDPNKWIGYGWVGRIVKDSTPDGRFDAGWLDADRRNDACKEYRSRASADVHFVADVLNSLPELLDAIARLEAEKAELVAALIRVRNNNRKGVTGIEARKAWDTANAVIAKAEGWS